MHTHEPRPVNNDRELESVADLVDRVFESPETTSAHRAMVRMPGFDPASLPAVWDEEGQAVATVQAVPCEVSLMGTWLPGGIITMVATAPEARGNGYMRACMEAAHQWMLDDGRPVGILYGVPAIYPKFGYRPVMPRCDTRYSLPPQGREIPVRAAGDEDAAVMAGLFNAQEQTRPCAVKRGVAHWIWQSQRGNSSLVCVEPDEQMRGYFIVRNDAEDQALTIVEAASQPFWEWSVVDGINSLARKTGKTRITLRLQPDHPLVMEIIRRVTSLDMHDVEQSAIPPQAGMLAILDPQHVLETLAPAIEARLAGRSLNISAMSGLSLQFNDPTSGGLHLDDSADLAHLLSGYPGARALHRWSRLTATEDSLNLAAQVFPTCWPRWITAPFWDS